MRYETSTLMCSPDFFEVTYSINPWMDERNPPVCRERALSQWRTLHSEISRCTEVELLAPEKGLPDMCFTANAGLVIGDVFVASRFRYPERRGEQKAFSDWFGSKGYRCRTLGSAIFEGAGDALFDDAGRLWLGYGQRTEQGAADALSDAFDLEVMALELIDPRFYHLDTCFAMIGGELLVYFPRAFSAESNELVERIVPSNHRIAVDEDDAAQLACNLVVIDDQIFMNAGVKRLGAQLRAIGFAVNELPLSEFLKSGGSAKCLTFTFGASVAADGRAVHASLSEQN